MRCPTLSELPSPPPGKTGWPWTEESPQLRDTMPDGRPWPKISIVTPNYNYGRFLEETIRSVLLQGYPNLEYIIIDGGSVDNSVKIIKKYKRWLTYWISEPDRGQNHAINKGLERATGEWANWLNSDDFLLPGALKSVGIAATSVPKMIYGLIFGCQIIIGDKTQLKQTWFPLVPASVSSFLDRKNYPIIPQPSTFIRRDKLKINLDYQYIIDWTFYLHLEDEYPGCFRAFNTIVAASRQHEKSKTSSAWDQFVKEAISFVGNYRFKKATERVAAKKWLKRVQMCKNISSSLDRGRLVSLILLGKIFLHYPGSIKERMFWGAVRRKILGV